MAFRGAGSLQGCRCELPDEAHPAQPGVQDAVPGGLLAFRGRPAVRGGWHAGAEELHVHREALQGEGHRERLEERLSGGARDGGGCHRLRPGLHPAVPGVGM